VFIDLESYVLENIGSTYVNLLMSWLYAGIVLGICGVATLKLGAMGTVAEALS
jgi:hypothetical protein